MKNSRKRINILPMAMLCFLLVMILLNRLWATVYFVSPQGSDEAEGTIEHPIATLRKATEMLQPGDMCYLRKGIYRETLRPKQSGRPGEEITYANWQDERVVISGAEVISGWKQEDDGVWSAPLPWNMEDESQIFVNGQMLVEASWPAPGQAPLFQPERATAAGGNTTTLVCEKIPGPDDAWKGSRLWCAGGSAWICWTSRVTGYDADSHTLTFDPPQKNWYTPRKGNLFALRGIRRALHAPGQWFYDPAARRLLLIPPKDATIDEVIVEAKRRKDAIDLSGRSHIHIRGIDFRAAGIRTDNRSTHLFLQNLHGRYVAHSNEKEISGQAGVLLAGHDNLLLSCDLGYSSSSVVHVSGHDNRVINCHIHHGGYGGLWRGTVVLRGRRIVFSHNTVRHAGRDLINTHGLMESLVQYNDVSDAGWLTKDLGMFYGHNTDFANTEFRYNLVHDNHAAHCAMGIYFDHLSHNALVHHNVIWNTGMDPIRFNNPSYSNLIFNNTCWRTGSIGTFDHSKRNDLFACRFFNNLFNQQIQLPGHVALYGNRIIEAPPFRNPENLDFRLPDPANEMVGAYAPDGRLWRAGCNLKNPPTPLPVYKPPHIAWMNTVRNACFESGTLEGWKRTDSGNGELVQGNGWGNATYGHSKTHATGTSKFELRLGPGRDGIRQVVTGLSPGIRYTLSAWLRVSNEREAIVLGVHDHGGPEVSISVSSLEWIRESIEFTTGPETNQATITIRKATDGTGYGWCDNLTLPLTSHSGVKTN